MASLPIGLPESIAFGEGFELDLRPRRLRHGSRVLKLERIPLEILLLLIEHPGDVITREQIVGRVGGKDVFLDTDNSIRGAIRKIRQVLKDDPEQPRFIQTVTGQGYRFIAPILSRPHQEIACLPDTPAPESFLDRPKKPEAAQAMADEHRAAQRVPMKNPWLVLGIASAVLVSLAIVLVLKKPEKRVDVPKIRSVAVLPLKSMSGDPSQEYFADEMTEEIIGRLAAIRDLRVISRTSVMQFKDPKQTIPEIARTLGVDAIVEGSVIRDGNRIRVHAQLIRAANDEHFWSETYDRELGDVLSLQSDVAQSIAQRVEVTVSGPEHARLIATRKVSPEAYISYLKGVYSNSNTKTGIEQSIAFFQDSINKDPTFAPAYLGLANAYGLLGTVFAGGPPEETRSKLMRAAQKALELDPELTGAHVLLAQTYERRWMWKESGEEFKRALEVQPNDSDAIRGLGEWLIYERKVRRV